MIHVWKMTGVVQRQTKITKNQSLKKKKGGGTQKTQKLLKLMCQGLFGLAFWVFFIQVKGNFTWESEIKAC